MTESRCALAVVMPVYNEEACIAGVAESVLKTIKAVPGALLFIINDGSKDNTAEILRKLSQAHPAVRVINQKNGGHGKAVVNGYKAAIDAGAEWIFQLDSDDQIPAGEFSKLWDRRGESPFVLGRRLERHDPLNRIVISKMNRLLVFLLFGVYLKDPNVPFRLMKADFLRKFLPQIEGVFAPNIFLSVLAKKQNVSTVDIPVVHKIRETGSPSINFGRLAGVCRRCVSELLTLRKSL